jgi:hypothetical protein
MSPADGRTQQLAAAIRGPREPANGLTPVALKHVALAASGNQLAIARQIYEDRATLLPCAVPSRFEGADPEVLKHWMDGEPVPDNHKESIAAWITAQTMRRRALGELERRLRASIFAWRVLSQSDSPDDKRLAVGFRRWHALEWGVVDVPMHAPAGQEQPTEAIVAAAVRMRAGR